MIKAETEQRLKDKEINPTTMRLLILDHLLEQRTATSLSDIEKGLATADRITIYRTLKTFEEHGLVHSIEDGTGVPKYAICLEECNSHAHHDLHVHFYCNSCKETFCLPKSKIPQIPLPNGFSFQEMNLVVKGVCDHCQA